eukprot:2060664-Pleurochrysis_carterae.AAC.1
MTTCTPSRVFSLRRRAVAVVPTPYLRVKRAHLARVLAAAMRVPGPYAAHPLGFPHAAFRHPLSRP